MFIVKDQKLLNIRDAHCDLRRALEIMIALYPPDHDGKVDAFSDNYQVVSDFIKARRLIQTAFDILGKRIAELDAIERIVPNQERNSVCQQH